MEKWILKNPKTNIQKLTEESGISELLCRILANRQITDPDSVREMVCAQAEEFDGFLMKDMKKAVELIQKALETNQRIRIISDYDVDGVISASILCDALRRLGACVDFHIPHRVTDGYGINENLVDTAAADEIKLIITCDNGISAVEAIRRAKDAGMTVIVTDHHEVPFTAEPQTGERIYQLPPADAVIDPKQADCQYPFPKLCGAGVVYKLIKCLISQMPEVKTPGPEGKGQSQETKTPEPDVKGPGPKVNMPDPKEYLELVAIATVCDVVDLVSENRTLLQRGLARMSCTKNIGLRALIEETKLTDKKINVYHLGFIIGPCLNASGRLEDAKKAVDLFLEKEPRKAAAIAAELVELNRQRKEMTQEGIEAVTRQVEDSLHPEEKVIVAYAPLVHESIAGIVAGRVRERFNLPTIVLTNGESEIKGSGRSIEEYNIFEEIQKCGDLLLRFGGHPMAAGLSMHKENIAEFAKRLNQICTLTGDDIAVKVCIDLNLSLEAVNFAVVEELERLEPYGKGNAKPLFGSKNVLIQSACVRGANQNVLSMKLKQAGGVKTLDAVFFGTFDIEALKEYNRIDIAYHIGINEYNGSRRLQLTVQHIRESQGTQS